MLLLLLSGSTLLLLLQNLLLLCLLLSRTLSFSLLSDLLLLGSPLSVSQLCLGGTTVLLILFCCRFLL